MKNGKDLIEELKNSIAYTEKIIADRYQRIGNGETDMDDCFVSQRSNELDIQVCKMKINILENEGLSTFPCLRDAETNEVVSRKIIQGAYGPCHLIDDEYVYKFGKFIGLAKKEETYTKKGLIKSTFLAPAWVTIKSNGSGMLGAYLAVADIFMSDINYFTGKRG